MGTKISFSYDVVLGTSLEMLFLLLTYCADESWLIPPLLATEVVFWAKGFHKKNQPLNYFDEENLS